MGESDKRNDDSGKKEDEIKVEQHQSRVFLPLRKLCVEGGRRAHIKKTDDLIKIVGQKTKVAVGLGTKHPGDYCLGDQTNSQSKQVCKQFVEISFF